MDGQTENLVPESEEKNEPIDIAQAFRMYNQQKQEAPANDVDDTEGTDDNEPEDVGGDNEVEADDDTPDNEPDGDSVGGSTDVIEPVDLSPAKQNYLKNLQNQAISNVRKKMSEDQIELWSMEDIYEKDEQTGRVTFHNPDDPQHPFSSRADAQKFIDAMNQEVTNYFRREVNAEQQRLVQKSAPVLQMYDFAPVYQQMSESEQVVLNDLIEPYAIYDNNNKIIGFNCNLQSVANTARQIAKRFQAASSGNNNNDQASKAQPSQQKQPGNRPANDLPTGNGLSEDEQEPKTIGEALKMYDEQQRNAKKKGK